MNITPGKWRLGGSMFDVETLDGIPVARVDIMNNRIVEAINNACLIAVAPELLEALISMVDQACEQYPHFESPRGQENINRAKEIIGRIGGL